MTARSQIDGTLPAHHSGSGAARTGVCGGIDLPSLFIAFDPPLALRTGGATYRLRGKAVAAGGVADTRGAASLAGAEARGRASTLGNGRGGERWSIVIPVDHNQTRTGFANGQVGLSDCPAARDIPNAPPPAFSRGVCGAVPPARVWPTAAVAGFERCLWTVGKAQCKNARLANSLHFRPFRRFG